MRIAVVLLSLLVAGGVGCKGKRTNNNNQPATKPVEDTNRGDQSTQRSTSDYPPGGVEGQPAEPATRGTAPSGTTGTGASGTGPAATPTTGTGESTTGTGAGTTDSMGTPATGATARDAGTQGTVDQKGNDRGTAPTR